jgi:hypothetical protein
MAGSIQDYPRFQGVLMKPGVRVYCHDSHDPCYDSEGTITAVVRDGPDWSFDVVFDGPSGSASGPPRRMSWYAVSPTVEEASSEDARQYLAQRSLRIFLCHASEDKLTIRALYSRLKELGFRPWLDEIDLAPGVEWQQAIETAVHSSHVILVCLSNASVTKTGFVQKEIHFALERALEMPEGAIYIIPVRLTDCSLPQRLSKWQAVDLYAQDGQERLTEALRRRAKSLALLPGA